MNVATTGSSEAASLIHCKPSAACPRAPLRPLAPDCSARCSSCVCQWRTTTTRPRLPAAAAALAVAAVLRRTHPPQNDIRNHIHSAGMQQGGCLGKEGGVSGGSIAASLSACALTQPMSWNRRLLHGSLASSPACDPGWIGSADAVSWKADGGDSHRQLACLTACEPGRHHCECEARRSLAHQDDHDPPDVSCITTNGPITYALAS